jgi:hypothetical protein
MEISPMAPIHDLTASRKATQHSDATYGDLNGMAAWVAGGSMLRPETTQGTRRVSATDPALVLLGRCDLADAARAADAAPGGLAARVCGTDTERR